MDLIPRSWTSAPDITSSTSTAASFADYTGTYANITQTAGASAKEFSTGDGELFQGYSDELLTFASVMCIIFTFIGIPGNLITIIALSRCNKARNATAIFIINLSLSDLLFCCFNLPLATSTFLQRSWNHGDLLCRLFPLMRYGLLAVSLFTILLITINRYVMIGHPRIYPRIYRNRYLAIMIAATWIGVFSILIPTYRGVWGTFGLDTEIGSCSILPDKNGNSPKEFLFITAFIVPCFCIVVCYARIFYIVRKTAFRSREPANINSSVRFGKTNPAQPENNDSDQQLIEKNSKVSKDENSELSSSISNSGVSSNDREQVQQQQWQMRPYLSKLRDDEMKYIDTSVESDFPPSLSVLKIRGKREGTPASKNDSIYESDEDNLKHDANAVCEENDSGYVKEATENVLPSNGGVEAIITELPLKTNDTVSEKIEKKGKRNYKSALKSSLNRVTKRRFHNNSTINTSNASILYPGRMSTKDKRLLKMILVIFLSFVICYLPITITKLWKGVTEMHWLNISGYLLIYLTTCINPFIYVVMSSEYRQAYWNLLRCKIGNRSSHNHRYAGVTKKASNSGLIKATMLMGGGADNCKNSDKNAVLQNPKGEITYPSFYTNLTEDLLRISESSTCS